MKIPAGKIDAFIQNPPADVAAALIYGPDTGLVSERTRMLAEKLVPNVNDPFSVVDLDLSQIKDDPTIIRDEMAAIGLGTGRRLVRIRDAGNTQTSALKNAFEALTADSSAQSFLLVTGGDIAPGSLRELFEKASHAAALPCYVEDTRSLTQVVQELFRQRNARVERDVIYYLAEYCQGDRMVAVSAVEKLLLYVGDTEHEITLEDAVEAIADTTESDIQDLYAALLESKLQTLDYHLNKHLLQGGMPVGILRMCQQYLLRIQQVIGHMESGASQDSAIDQLRPRIFFKQMPSFKRHVGLFARKKALLPIVLQLLYRAESHCKQTGAQPELLCSHYLFQAARYIGRKR